MRRRRRKVRADFSAPSSEAHHHDHSVSGLRKRNAGACVRSFQIRCCCVARVHRCCEFIFFKEGGFVTNSLDRVGVDVVNDRDFFSVGGLKVSLVVGVARVCATIIFGFVGDPHERARRRRRARVFWSSPLFFCHYFIMDSSDEQHNLPHFAPVLFRVVVGGQPSTRMRASI